MMLFLSGILFICGFGLLSYRQVSVAYARNSRPPQVYVCAAVSGIVGMSLAI